MTETIIGLLIIGYLLTGLLGWLAIEDWPATEHWPIIVFWPTYLIFAIIWLVIKGGYMTYKTIKSWDWNMKS